MIISQTFFSQFSNFCNKKKDNKFMQGVCTSLNAENATQNHALEDIEW